MPLQYATSAQFLNVYSLRDISVAQVDTYLQRASARVTEQLAPLYATPFSSNNATSRELTIDIAALGFLLRSKDRTDSQELRGDVVARFAALLDGTAQMVTDSGAVLDRSGLAAQLWSSTKDYKSVFDLREADEQRVDPDQLDHFVDQDNT